MKKLSKHLTFFLLITSIIIPILPAIAGPKTSAPVIYRTSSSAQIVTGNWDPAISDGYNVLMDYWYLAAEFPMSGYARYFGGLQKVKEEEWWPIIVESWETEFRPEENNTAGFNNTGGRNSILFNLRSGVKFHDGSDWNASVMKWNIDRMYLITGNLTGNANGIMDQRNTANIWDPVADWEPYFSATFNLSEYDAPAATGFPSYIPPDPSRYSYYYLSDPDGVSPIIANNSNPYGGWAGPPINNWIHYAPYDQFPMVRWVEIVEDLPSGGKVRVHWNSFNSYGMEGGVWIPMISKQAYAADYTETGIYGYDNDDPGPDHMIGTGPYKFVQHDEINDRGYMVKFEDYWNKTALEAEGWYDVDRFEIIQFAPGNLGKDARNAALLTHEIDYAYDSMTMPLDYNAVMADPNINYYEDYVSQFQTQITLNSINETWWSGGELPLPWPPWTYNFSGVNIPGWYPTAEFGDPAANGIPIALREALTFAFDHDTLINVDLNGRAVRGGGIVGVANIFYNASIPLPGYNLTYAREVLLNQNGIDTRSLTHVWWPINFTQRLADRGLDAGSTDLEWQNIANTNPIFEINFYWDDVHQDLKDQFELAANQLGVALVDPEGDNKAPAGTTLWGNWLSTYWTKPADAIHSVWSAQAWMLDWDVPMTIPEGWLATYYGDPNQGSWRDPFVQWVTDFWPHWNHAFVFDAEIDYWIGVMYMSEPQRKKEMIGNMANKLQNELFPMIYTYQTKGGEALWANWETFWVLDRDDRPAGFWGGISPHFLSYTPGVGEFPLIPGAPLLVTLTVTATSMLGIIFILMRKKKLR